MEFLGSFFSYDSNSLLLFTGINFWIFFGIILFGYSYLHSKVRWRNVFLLLANLFFYHKCGGWFVILLFLAVTANYYLGIWMGRIPEKRQRKKLLLLSIFLNLGMLVWFKYTAFFITLFNQVSGSHLKLFNFIAWGFNQVSGTHFNISEILV